MSTAKAGKLLAKALDNSSKEEATTAFGMAFSYAERAGIRLSSIHRVEVIETKGGSITPERERELVEKYNRTLARAKELSEQLREAERQAERYLDQAATATVEARELRAQLEAGGVTDDMRSALNLAKELRDAYKKSQADLREAQANTARAWESVAGLGEELDSLRQHAEYLEDQLTEARRRYTAPRHFEDSQEAAQLKADLSQARSEREELRAANIELSAKVEELEGLYTQAVIRRNNLAGDVQRLRDTALQMEKDKRDLTRQLKESEDARKQHTTTAEELAAALAECMALRATVSQQTEEMDALRSHNRLLQIELDKHEINPLKKIFNW